ncbi:hypothetical protein LV716_18370 [Flagellimonas sp. HMM57]|uniref:hypothetical protein n=1 Tax=unclassified Flagellimonas TaxID=2644544 RepID=UPI0013D89E6B|nr:MULTISPECIES: hypothetical protein [unclassified Flagellimonas]UII76205.1 hypothetical protein LV716_18370 [Flagellimonas sp. HMM57]
MKSFFVKALVICVILFLLGCNAYKAQKQEAQLNFPALGTLIKTKGDLWYSAVEQVGVPDWSALKVDVQQLPFNRTSYGSYARYMEQAGKINSIAYVDSLPYKPKYLRLQLLDKLGMTQLLNTDTHKELRSYIAQDEGYKLVTGLDITVPETEMPSFLQAEAVQLQKDTYGNIQLVTINGTTENRYFFSELQIFGYQYANFCWGEDRYHNLIIENLLSEKEKCPKGTYLKSIKVNGDRSYLKF